MPVHLDIMIDPYALSFEQYISIIPAVYWFECMHCSVSPTMLVIHLYTNC